MPEWGRTLGAVVDRSATGFCVWAPEHEQVELVLESADADTHAPGTRRDIRPLARDDRGHWHGRFEDVRPGARYRFRLDRRDDAVFPDPASRSQPDGVHRPSRVVDPARFQWTDGDWRPPSQRDLVLYELHVGTFSPEGTYRGVANRLEYLAQLGVTAIELMPLGDFPGARNWGYDGVAIFAPARCYGTPDDLRALVDTAHQHGLAVYLDVVYNHFGPDGAYLHAFSPHYFTERHHTAWGAAINLDGHHSDAVRRFFVENALHWVREYHVDGLRLDATHALRDDSGCHFLAELTAAVREHAGRPVIVTAEDHRNLARMLRSVDRDGFGIDAVWADDFHHQVRVHTAGDRESYYSDFAGSTADLATTIRQGWFYTGQPSTHHGHPRGTSAAGLDPKKFVVCIQNHDQVGNRADGARLHHEVDDAVYRAATTLLLMTPQIPLLFMGQEWAARSPFLFFTDHHDELGRQITEGRRQEFSGFRAFADPRRREAIPDPQHEDTFTRSRLDWDEVSRPPHGAVLRLYRRLLALRRLPLVRDATCRSYHVEALDAHTLALALNSPPPGDAAGDDTLHVVVRLSGAGTVTLPARTLDTVLTTEDAEFVDEPRPVGIRRAPAAELSGSGLAECEITFARPGAIMFRSERRR